jgi:hypothetical protein
MVVAMAEQAEILATLAALHPAVEVEQADTQAMAEQAVAQELVTPEQAVVVVVVAQPTAEDTGAVVAVVV